MKLQRKNIVCIWSPTDFKTISQHCKIIQSFCSNQKLTARTPRLLQTVTILNCSPVGRLVQVAEFRLIQESCINTNIIKDDQFLNPEVQYGGKGN